ncbi:MAG: hypothetical protein H7X79_12915 [Sporomusaceae bacterium]|nr:hypothetical protein [Sporomusaceae bacterium]
MISRHYTVAIVLSTALAFTIPAGVDAATLSTSTFTASIGDVSISSSQREASGGNVRFAQVLSSNYNRTISPVEVLRLRTDFDFGLGDISLIYAAAVYSGRPVDEISFHRRNNMGWGEIAKLYGVKVKDLKKGNDDVINAARVQGVDVIYIEIDDNNRDNDDHGKHDNAKGYGKQDNSKDHDKQDNGKGHGNKK